MLSQDSLLLSKREITIVYINVFRFMAPFRPKKTSCGTPACQNDNLRHPQQQSTNEKTVMKYSYMLYQYLAATQTPCDGNFVYHGTLVGNHWSIEMQQAQRSFSSQSCVISALRPCGRLNRFFGRNQHCLLEVCNSIFLEKYFI